MNKKVILLVEDNENDETLMVQALKKNHITNEIVVARDGEEALNYLFGRGPYVSRDVSLQPQVIFLDLNLPKINGHEVLKRLRADPRSQRIPVVVLTTSDEENDILSSYSLGANSYVRKPLEFQQLIVAVQQLGLYWLIINQTSP